MCDAQRCPHLQWMMDEVIAALGRGEEVDPLRLQAALQLQQQANRREAEAWVAKRSAVERREAFEWQGPDNRSIGCLNCSLPPSMELSPHRRGAAAGARDA